MDTVLPLTALPAPLGGAMATVFPTHYLPLECLFLPDQVLNLMCREDSTLGEHDLAHSTLLTFKGGN